MVKAKDGATSRKTAQGIIAERTDRRRPTKPCGPGLREFLAAVQYSGTDPPTGGSKSIRRELTEGPGYVSVREKRTAGLQESF